MIRIEWGFLVAYEPTSDELVLHADALAAGYNDPVNAELMSHTAEIAPHEVIENYEAAIAEGMHAFLLFDNGHLVGDADLRNFKGGSAEFAFMIAARSAQGKGLGTRFAIMLHAYGFRELGLHHIYASLVPHNTASRRVFEKLGYIVDDSPEGRAYAEEPTDVTMSLERSTFLRLHQPLLSQIQFVLR